MNSFSRSNRDFHTPVLLNEVIDGLKIKKDAWYIDATVGGGGHTAKILKRGGKVLGIDQDEDAILHIKKKFERQIAEGKLIPVLGNFSNVGKIAEKEKISDFAGILMDLGVSSYQLEDAGRGFSFLKDEELDMRMGRKIEITAADIVNNSSYDDLYNIFSKFGEERKADEVAQKIIQLRQKANINTTHELSELVATVIPRTGEIHPSTKIFQALRIAVNNELDALRNALRENLKLLKKEGRMVIISFHSLEDRIVKLFILDEKRLGKVQIITKTPIVASESELEKNRRARSAKLRIIKKI